LGLISDFHLQPGMRKGCVYALCMTAVLACKFHFLNTFYFKSNPSDQLLL